MSILEKQFLDVYTPPELTTSLLTAPQVDQMSFILKSRQTISMPFDQIVDLIKDNDILMCDFVKEGIGNIDRMEDVGDYSEITNGFGISEYIGGMEKYLPSLQYLSYCKKNNQDVKIDVYAAENLFDIDHRPESIRNKVSICSGYRRGETISVPKFEFTVPEMIKYTRFTETKYASGVLVPMLQDPVVFMSLNLPYYYYKYQPLHPNVYNWDVINECHMFADLTAEEFSALFEEITTNGITEPIFMRMNGETLTTVDNRSDLIIFIAKVLNLPTIPVTVYLSNDFEAKNHLIDHLVQYNKELQRMVCESTSRMFHIFEPYILLYKEPENPNSSSITVNGNEYKRECYNLFMKDDHVTVRYLDPNSEVTIANDEKQIEALHEELRLKEQKALSDNIQAAIDMLTSHNE